MYVLTTHIYSKYNTMSGYYYVCTCPKCIRVTTYTCAYRVVWKVFQFVLFT